MTDDERQRQIAEHIRAKGVIVCPPGDNMDFQLYRHEQSRRQSNGRVQSKGARGRGPKGAWFNPTRPSKGLKRPSLKQDEPG